MLAIEDCNWNLGNFVVIKYLVAIGSNFVEVVAIVEGLAIGFGCLTRVGNSKQQNSNYQWEKMN